MNPDDKSSLLQTKAFIAQMKLGAAGWDSKIEDPALATMPLTYLYVFDQPSGWTWVCAIPRELFLEFSTRGHLAKDDYVVTRSALTQLITQAAAGVAIEDVEGVGWEKQLVMVLSVYSGTTQTWELADRLKDGGHFVVMLYRKPDACEGMLRPFVLRCQDDEILPASYLKETLGKVQRQDNLRNPHWFL